MKREIQALRLGEFAGEGIVAPGAEIRPGIGEVAPKQGRHRSDRLGRVQGLGLVGGIHAVLREQNP